MTYGPILRQGICVVASVFWLLMCRIAPAALHEDTSAARHPADAKAKRLEGDPEGSSDKPMRNDRLVRPDLAKATASDHGDACGRGEAEVYARPHHRRMSFFVTNTQWPSLG